MVNKFKTHDIVKDSDGYKFRIYEEVKGVEGAYDVVALDAVFYGHTVRSESELVMEKEYINKVWSEEKQEWEVK